MLGPKFPEELFLFGLALLFLLLFLALSEMTADVYELTLSTHWRG